MFLRWATTAGTLMLLPTIFGKNVDVKDWKTALLAAAVVGVIHIFVRPFMRLVSLPITILSLGLFNLVINATCLWIATKVMDGFRISSFGIGILAALVLSIVTAIADKVFDDKD
jgi:putative membrane protein